MVKGYLKNNFLNCESSSPSLNVPTVIVENDLFLCKKFFSRQIKALHVGQIFSIKALKEISFEN